MTPSAQIVHDTLAASVPPGSPLMFTKIVHAHSTGRDRRRAVFADLIMFDGKPSAVKLEPFQMGDHRGWSIQWITLPGGAISLENGQWVRVQEEDPAA